VKSTLYVQIPVNPAYPRDADALLEQATEMATGMSVDAEYLGVDEVTGTARAERVEAEITTIPGLRTYEFRFRGTRSGAA
jgi:hypothetical protein